MRTTPSDNDNKSQNVQWLITLLAILLLIVLSFIHFGINNHVTFWENLHVLISTTTVNLLPFPIVALASYILFRKVYDDLHTDDRKSLVNHITAKLKGILKDNVTELKGDISSNSEKIENLSDKLDKLITELNVIKNSLYELKVTSNVALGVYHNMPMPMPGCLNKTRPYAASDFAMPKNDSETHNNLNSLKG